ncbi:hypothetical protein VTH06DRAFT_1508 [Thermothelomyces fergusii]
MSNNDNAMARFLFAILQQKCLKDIDWNKVAHNPILAQEITNGHAARMRFSRFRAAMLGLEPQRRNRTANSGNNNKNRVAKKKKDDSPKLKKEDDENVKSSGSGIGNIKMEKTTTTGVAVKSERRGSSQQFPQPSQPPASRAAPVMMKAEPGLVNPFSQHQNRVYHDSLLSRSSPRVKPEKLMTPTAANKTSPATEPPPFGILAAVTPTTSPSVSSTPYMDSSHHQMQGRLPTPCSDIDGALAGMHGFVSHSPSPAELLHHSQHHPHPVHHHHHVVGAGSSPPLSAAGLHPYDFSQHPCCDFSAGGFPGSSSRPWHSQHQHHSRLDHSPSHAQTQAQAMFSPNAPGFDFGLGLGLGLTTDSYTLEAGFNNNNNINDNTNSPICGSYHDDIHHHHPLCHDEDGRPVMDDSLCLHGIGGAAPDINTAASPSADADAGVTETQAKREQEGETKFTI